MVGAAASAKNAHHVQVAKLIKEWGNKGVSADLCESLCEPVELIFPDEEVECINKVKCIFKHKTLAFELAVALILVKKIKVTTAAVKVILYTLNITATPQEIGQKNKSIIDTRKQAHK